LILVDVKETTEGLDIGNSRMSFGGKPLPAMPRAPNSVAAPIYITHDGKRVLLPAPVDDNPAMNLTLVSNWTAEVKK
jgi:hypothetical protein